jgi:hypothetical protein
MPDGVEVPQMMKRWQAFEEELAATSVEGR